MNIFDAQDKIYWAAPIALTAVKLGGFGGMLLLFLEPVQISRILVTLFHQSSSGDLTQCAAILPRCI